MANGDWYPTSDAALIPWHQSFAQQAATHVGQVAALTAAAITQININRDNVLLTVTAVQVAKNYLSEITAYKRAILRGSFTLPLPVAPTLPSTVSLAAGSLQGIEAWTRRIVGQIKADSNYTDQLGQDLGIVAAPLVLSDPAVTAIALTQSQVRLNVSKGGYMTVAVDSRRGGGAWELLVVLTSTPYVDLRPPLVAGQPELREYRVQGYMDNARQGALSQAASAVTVP